MTFYGISESQLRAIAQKLNLTIENLRQNGKGISLKLTPLHSSDKYARTGYKWSGYSGRKVKACSYEAFRDFNLSAFANGCTSITTLDPLTFKNKRMTQTEYESRLDGFYWYNIGSMMQPCTMGSCSNQAVPVTVVTV